MSGDRKYIEWREEEKVWDAPKNIIDGAGKGLMDFGRAIGSGVVGVVKQPYKETKKSGFGGFFKGVGKGFAGLIVKPVSGTLDLISKTTEGVKNTAKDKDLSVERKRLPWPFYDLVNIFKSFNDQDAYAIGVLRQQDVIQDNLIFKASYQVTQQPIHLIAIFQNSLFKIKWKVDKPGSVKKAFKYQKIQLVERTNSSVVIHILISDPQTGNSVTQTAEINVENTETIEKMYSKFKELSSETEY